MSQLLALKRKVSLFYLVPLSLAVILTLSLLFPQTAYAIDLSGIIPDIVTELLVNEILVPICEKFLNLFLEFITSITMPNILTASFTDFFGNTGGTSLYSLVKVVHDSVIVPIAHSILALVMLVQVVKISQKIDANATMPAVKEIVFLVVFFVIFTWLINNSSDICVMVYDTVNQITTAIGSVGDLDIAVSLGDTSNISIGSAMGLLLFTVVGFVLSGIAWIVCFAMTYVRMLQLYFYATFSPIPFAFLGFEETRSFGVNFCRNFIAICLAGAIMAFALVAFPFLAAGVVADTGIGFVYVSGGISDLVFLRLMAISIVLIQIMTKSGAIAKDILGA